ncbi:MAG: Ig domain-containing protein, partial [Gemmatimonadetes bacterium]|nr:Ig domain-containing protein [Gemmatimonadota bacterium]
PGDSLAFSTSGLPGFCSLTDNGNRTGSIACSPGVGDSGTFNVIVTVTDDGVPPLGDSDTFVLTVNAPPSLSTLGNQTVEQESTLNIPLSATDPDSGDSLAYSETGLPTFCSLTDNGDRTASIACNPGGGDSGTFNVTVTVTDDGSPALSDSDTFDLTVILLMDIDIKPGSDPNSINLKSKGNIPVAILTTDTFYALEADPLSIEFGPGQATESHGRGHVKDVDGDGDMDLVLHFNMRDTGIGCGDTVATLTGETFGGQALTGSDAVRIVKCR